MLGFRKCPVSVSVYASGSKGSLPNCWESYLVTGTAGLTESHYLVPFPFVMISHPEESNLRETELCGSQFQAQ